MAISTEAESSRGGGISAGLRAQSDAVYNTCSLRLETKCFTQDHCSAINTALLNPVETPIPPCHLTQWVGDNLVC